MFQSAQSKVIQARRVENLSAVPVGNSPRWLYKENLGKKVRKLFGYQPMANLTNRQRRGGGEFHVADCHIWAEIYYLDSPTDYREYLSENVPLQSRPRSEPMVLLDDDSDPSFWSLAKVFFGLLIPLLGILLIVLSHD